MTRDPRRTTSLLFVILVSLIIVGYAFDRSKNLLEGPVIELITPVAGQTVTDSVIPVAGTARNIAKLTLNGRAISVNEKGEFLEPLIVSPGYTVMTITAEDKFGKRRELELPLYREKRATTTSQTS